MTQATVTPHLMYIDDIHIGKCKHPSIKIVLKENGMIVGACQFCAHELTKSEMEAILSHGSV